MANLLFTSFHGLAANGALSNTTLLRRQNITGIAWQGGSLTMNLTGGRFGEPALDIGSGYLVDFDHVAASAYIGFCIRGIGAAINDSEWFFLYAADGSVALKMRWTSSRLVLQDSTGATIGTSATTFIPSVNYFVEVGFASMGAAVTTQVRINGALEISGSADTQPNTQTALLKWRIIGNNSTPYRISAVYANDATGAAPHNGFYGDVRVYVGTLSANDAVQFTPLSSTNVSNVDDGNAPDAGTTYNSSSTVGHRDTFSITGLPTAGTVLGVCVRTLAAKDTAGARSLASVVKSGTTVSTGTGRSLSTDYSEAHHYTYVDPDTSSPYDPADLNSLKVGYEITA